jgi:single-strand DNA-binding protein
MIKLQVIGHLGKDSIVNQVNGKYVVNFSVAHSEKFKNQQGVETNKTTWVECAQWSDRQPNVAQYLKKGTQVFVEGQPEVRTYPKNDGSTGASMNLRVFSLQLLGGNQNTGGQQQQQPTGGSYVDSAAQPENIGPVDDLPF